MQHEEHYLICKEEKRECNDHVRRPEGKSLIKVVK